MESVNLFLPPFASLLCVFLFCAKKVKSERVKKKSERWMGKAA